MTFLLELHRLISIFAFSRMLSKFISKWSGNTSRDLLMVATIVIPCAALGQDGPDWDKWGKTYEEKVLPIIKTKCLDCHSGEKPDGEFDLLKYTDGSKAIEAGDIWDRVARRVRLNEMPPPGSPGLSDPEKSAFHRWVDTRPGQDLCHKLASDETQSWYRGYVMSRRLSRTEYANAIRDLTGVTLSKDMLPPSDGAGGEGFDTAGDALFTSPIHLESYLRVTIEVVNRMIPSEDWESVRQWNNSRNTALRLPERSATPQEETQHGTDFVPMTIRKFAERAWRRTIGEDELSRLMSLYSKQLAAGKSTLHSMRAPLQAVLLSPHFLFVVETEPQTAGIQRLSPHQFATRMALLVWSSVPDETLLEHAASGDIFEESVIQSELSRMLEDTRSRSLGENFGLQWLGLKEWELAKPDEVLYPQFDSVLASDAIEETVLFVSSVFREKRPLIDLITSDYAFLTKRLGEHYGIDESVKQSIPDTGWSRVSLTNAQRGGVITMASVLTKTSYPSRTSPVLRGRWLLEEILGARVPPPPPNVPALEDSSHGEANQTLRQRLEAHRTNPECASCHNRMDPLGFGLENFDAIGRWRVSDNGQTIDSSGSLPSGESFRGPEELKKLVLSRRGEFENHVTRKLVGFALGRELNKFDQCVIDASLKRLREENRADVILEEILKSYPFQHRYYNPAKSTQ